MEFMCGKGDALADGDGDSGDDKPQNHKADGELEESLFQAAASADEGTALEAADAFAFDLQEDDAD